MVLLKAALAMARVLTSEDVLLAVSVQTPMQLGGVDLALVSVVLETLALRL